MSNVYFTLYKIRQQPAPIILSSLSEYFQWCNLVDTHYSSVMSFQLQTQHHWPLRPHLICSWDPWHNTVSSLEHVWSLTARTQHLQVTSVCCPTVNASPLTFLNISLRYDIDCHNRGKPGHTPHTPASISQQQSTCRIPLYWRQWVYPELILFGGSRSRNVRKVTSLTHTTTLSPARPGSRYNNICGSVLGTH